MKWYGWVGLIYVAMIIALCLWYLIDEDKKKRRHHKKCKEVRKAHEGETVERTTHTPEEYLHYLGLINRNF